MKKLLFILALSVFALSACGQKGPLYLPESTAETSASVEANNN